MIGQSNLQEPVTAYLCCICGILIMQTLNFGREKVLLILSLGLFFLVITKKYFFYFWEKHLHQRWVLGFQYKCGCTNRGLKEEGERYTNLYFHNSA